MEPSDWEKDRLIAGAARSAFDGAVRHALAWRSDWRSDFAGGPGLDPIAVPYLDAVRALVTEFEEEPERMGAAVASVWQDRAIELSKPAVKNVQGPTRLLTQIAIQVAAIVYQLARRQGGERYNLAFGYGFMFVRTAIEDRALQVHPDIDDFTFEPRDMLDFIYLRAHDLGVPVEELAGKKARRGL